MHRTGRVALVCKAQTKSTHHIQLSSRANGESLYPIGRLGTTTGANHGIQHVSHIVWFSACTHLSGSISISVKLPIGTSKARFELKASNWIENPSTRTMLHIHCWLHSRCSVSLKRVDGCRRAAPCIALYNRSLTLPTTHGEGNALAPAATLLPHLLPWRWICMFWAPVSLLLRAKITQIVQLSTNPWYFARCQHDAEY